MTAAAPPDGTDEADYEAIEAAVTETVRGRWFLNEFSRRNRLAETRQLLDAIIRIESAVTSGQTALPSADPSIRLLIQRIKEIASRLGTVAGEMRTAGIESRFVEAVDDQARAVAGMMRGGAPDRAALAGGSRDRTQIEASRPRPVELPSTPSESLPAEPQTAGAQSPAAATAPPARGADDPRLAALSRLDRLAPREKLGLFT